MASRTSRREWVRGLPWAFGVGRYDRKRIHSPSERSVGYFFLIGESVRNYPNPHLYQTGSQFEHPRIRLVPAPARAGDVPSEVDESFLQLGVGEALDLFFLVAAFVYPF